MKRFIVLGMLSTFLMEIPASAMGTLQSNIDTITQWAQEKKANAKRLFFCARNPSQCSSQEAQDARKWVIGVPIATIVTVAAIAGIAIGVRKAKRMKIAAEEEKKYVETLNWLRKAESPSLEQQILTFYEGPFTTFFGKTNTAHLYKEAMRPRILKYYEEKTIEQRKQFVKELEAFLTSVYQTNKNIESDLEQKAAVQTDKIMERMYRHLLRQLIVMRHVRDVLTEK